MEDQCIVCSKSLVEGGDFCPFCGTKIVPSSTTSAIDSYIQNKVNLELSTRLKDQSSLVRELGDRAEDVVWKRLTRYGVLASMLLACILGGFTFVGLNTLDGVSKRVEPVVAAAEQRAKAARQTIEETATKVDLVRSSLDKLSIGVDTQTKRVTEKSGEISRKLQSLDAAVTGAQKRGEAYQSHSDDLSRRLEAMAKTLDQQTSRVTQISKQVDNFSIRQVYPTLGQEKFVTFQSGRWKGPGEKGPTERWFNIVIDPMIVGDFSPDQIEKLMAELKRAGYTPLLGSFGIGGPYATGYGSLGDSNETTVLYFKKASEQMALDVGAIASKILLLKDLKARFADVSAFTKDDGRRFVIENSGLDLQLVLLRSRQR